ncbi:hypothetical protein [Embleya hyalina]|uniref:Lipoprotein n=1 Tax=Embleya hyalina TaxID=516124 RepID=A0A401YFY6_9ACTN|nr:hypothetical protein [Embleya hyalina]GCD93524.1 hypothetical protein EHYA_01168 [Embleya hyalina]
MAVRGTAPVWRKVAAVALGMLLAIVSAGCGGDGGNAASSSAEQDSVPDEGRLRKYLDGYVALLNAGDVPKLARHLDIGGDRGEQDAELRMSAHGRQQWRDVTYAWEQPISVDLYDVKIKAFAAATSSWVHVDEKVVWKRSRDRWVIVSHVPASADPRKPRSGTERTAVPGLGPKSLAPQAWRPNSG